MAASGRRATATSTSACEVSNLNAARGCSGIGGDVTPRSGFEFRSNQQGRPIGGKTEPPHRGCGSNEATPPPLRRPGRVPRARVVVSVCASAISCQRVTEEARAPLRLPEPWQGRPSVSRS